MASRRRTRVAAWNSWMRTGVSCQKLWTSKMNFTAVNPWEIDGQVDGYIIKGSWEAKLPCYGQIEFWDLKWWRVVRDWEIDLDEGWCETLHDITIHQKRIDLDEGWCETLHYITIHNKKIDLDEGWCETLHYITIHHKREVVTKGSGEEGKWWWREVVTKGSGEEGKWWRREVVRKGSGDEGKWWRREVVMKGSGDEGKRWRREVVKKGSGDEGKWSGREVVTKGSGEEAGARNLVFFRVKWLQPAMKGTSSVRRVRLGSFCARMVPPTLLQFGTFPTYIWHNVHISYLFWRLK